MARPTLEMVARAAGVSRQTVSNVLNSPDRVRPATRARVHAVISDLGYRPSRAAQQLRTQRSRTLAMRMEPHRDGVNGVVLDRFLHAFVEGAQRAGYRVLLYTADDDHQEIQTFGDLVSTSDIDGIVLTSTHHGDPRTAWLSEHGIPFSTFGRPWGAPPAPHSWVDIDGAAGTRHAVTQLTARGHRRIAFLGWPTGSGVGDDRRDGWRLGLADASLPAAAELDVMVDDGILQGAEATERLLNLPDAPSAVVCASDSLALGALLALDRSGSERRLAVVGFDDTPAAAAVDLTSIAQPLTQAAQACLDQVLTSIHEPNAPSVHVLLEPSLVERGSTTV
ncbi:LacI family DNA-binding transcriptional regulator [Kineosporiaceae bacterium SCSIO 59966]|nr:LacI family DNA-binding transcriptional regulator [Kineosporiaceae bacterium SCSIO 59966]